MNRHCLTHVVLLKANADLRRLSCRTTPGGSSPFRPCENDTAVTAFKSVVMAPRMR